MGPTWGPSGADKAQVGPMLAPWTLLSRLYPMKLSTELNCFWILHRASQWYCRGVCKISNWFDIWQRSYVLKISWDWSWRCLSEGHSVLYQPQFTPMMQGVTQLSYWQLNKMADLYTISLSVISWNEIFENFLNFCQNSACRVDVTVSENWFRKL